ncbi:SLC13 family permease [Salinirussus salinus]|uniref:SLC13 family permease n=1 Tax=Salinirussus salinus TaxID=1198300 RepID=UPI0037439EF9
MPAVTAGTVVVFVLILAALVLFATEPVPVDVTALTLLVALVLVDPVTQGMADAGLLAEPVYVLRSPGEDVAAATARGLSGFASSATITVLAMFILSGGVQRTGVVQRLGERVAGLTGDSEGRQVAATIGIVSPLSGFINNTAAVAVLLPMVSDLAHKTRNSPSKLLLPLSYASMFGGMLTLIGTSTNILASELYAEFSGRPFSMFEFTQLGVVVTVVGAAYLLTVGRWLTPTRIEPEADLTSEFGLEEYLTEVVVREDSVLVGKTVSEGLSAVEFDVDVLQLVRDGRAFAEPLEPKTIRAGDVLAVRVDRDTLVDLLDAEGLDVLADVEVTDEELEAPDEASNLVEVVVAPGSRLVGESLAGMAFRQQYDATVLALRRGGELIRERMDDLTLRVGDTLLVQGASESLTRLEDNPDFIVAQEIERPDVRSSKTPVAVGLVAAVVGLAALTPIPIVAAALAGALGMVLTGCLRPTEVYDTVQWDVIFLLAGVIPLGLALETTGGAALIADGVVAASATLPAVAVLGLLYVITAVLTNIVSNNASVVLMVPVAIEVAGKLPGDAALAFVLAVTFAASTAFMTPVGYQTNLFVYGPGGYRFTDYVRVGGPLQAIFTVVTTLGIAFFWGV